MNKNLQQIFQQLSSIWKELGFNQRVSIVVAGLAVIAGLIGVVAWTSRVEYAVLFGKIEEAEAAKVISSLDDAKVPYKINRGSGTISVPADKVHQMRMQLAAKGIPSGGRTGFSLFDKPNFGISDFAQRVNFSRAVQGELANTIQQVDGVESANVILVMPENRLLVDNLRRPSASVFVKLRGNVPLSPAQVNAIRFLVANAVEGLTPASVSITDNLGNLLTDATDGDPISGATATQLKARKEYEQYLTRKAQEMLETVLGRGQSVVRVSVELDSSTLQRTETKYDPEGQVLRTATITDENTESTTAAGSSGGAPGTSSNSNLDTNTVASAASQPVNRNNNKKKVSQNQFEINQTVTSMNQAPGTIRRISAAVFVAQRMTDQGTNRVAQPRTPEEMQKIRRIVQSALGIQENAELRKDELNIEETSFNDESQRQLVQQLEKTEQRKFWTELGQNAVFPLLGLAVLGAFWRFFQKTPVEEISIGVPVGPGGQAYGAMGSGLKFPKPVDSKPDDPYIITPEILNQLVRENPANMTQALRTWMTRSERAK
jgi:flagellar M-ring protein FliF